jgi:hypothetical protein
VRKHFVKKSQYYRVHLGCFVGPTDFRVVANRAQGGRSILSVLLLALLA